MFQTFINTGNCTRIKHQEAGAREFWIFPFVYIKKKHMYRDKVIFKQRTSAQLISQEKMENNIDASKYIKQRFHFSTSNEGPSLLYQGYAQQTMMELL